MALAPEGLDAEILVVPLVQFACSCSRVVAGENFSGVSPPSCPFTGAYSMTAAARLARGPGGMGRVVHDHHVGHTGHWFYAS